MGRLQQWYYCFQSAISAHDGNNYSAMPHLVCVLQSTSLSTLQTCSSSAPENFSSTNGKGTSAIRMVGKESWVAVHNGHEQSGV